MTAISPTQTVKSDSGRVRSPPVSQPTSSWLHRPSGADVWLGIRLCLAVDALIFLLYGGCNRLTALRSQHLALYFPQELGIPLLPWAIWPYLSLFPLFLLLFFCVPGARAPAVARTYITGLGLSAVAWLALPAKLGFQRILPAGYEGPFGFIFSVDFPHNLVPSLHVVFGYLTVVTCVRNAPCPARFALWTWFSTMVAATVLTHQHHLADAVSGVLVGWMSYRLAPPERPLAHASEGVSQ